MIFVHTDDEEDEETILNLRLSQDEFVGLVAGIIVFILILVTLFLLLCVCLIVWKRRKSEGKGKEIVESLFELVC